MVQLSIIYLSTLSKTGESSVGMKKEDQNAILEDIEKEVCE